MADSDPENKINNVESPGDGNVVPPCPDAGREGVANQSHSKEEGHERARQSDEPGF